MNLAEFLGKRMGIKEANEAVAFLRSSFTCPRPAVTQNGDNDHKVRKGISAVIGHEVGDLRKLPITASEPAYRGAFAYDAFDVLLEKRFLRPYQCNQNFSELQDFLRRSARHDVTVTLVEEFISSSPVLKVAKPSLNFLFFVRNNMRTTLLVYLALRYMEKIKEAKLLEGLIEVLPMAIPLCQIKGTLDWFVAVI